MNQEFQRIVDFRRSNRAFDANTQVPEEIIRVSLERAILSPNSSNMQLWEFHWLKTKKEIDQMAPLCLGQRAASTAQQMVVFVTRRDKWKSRAQWNANQLKASFQGEPTKQQKNTLAYYEKLMPLVYSNDPFGLLTAVRRTLSFFMGLTRPFFRLSGKASQRIVTHKSCALAAQTFMLSVSAEGFHTCPMEGFDEKRVKRLLKLPRKAEINMIISVGLGTPEGVWGERNRVPYNEVVIEH